MPESPDPRPEPIAPRAFLPLPSGRLTAVLLAFAFLVLALTAGLAAVLLVSVQTPDEGAPAASADARAHVL